jgi:hypothetical protein
MTSDAGALLLGETDRAIGMMRRFAVLILLRADRGFAREERGKWRGLARSV